MDMSYKWRRYGGFAYRWLITKGILNMKPFNYKEALEGKLCKTANNMYVLLLSDANTDERVYPKPVKPLVGLVFDNDWLCSFRYWDYDGKSSLPEERTDIIGILDENELDQLKNVRILREAIKRECKVQWDSNVYEKDSVWNVKKMDLTYNFILSCDPWVLQTDGSDLPNLRIIEE